MKAEYEARIRKLKDDYKLLEESKEESLLIVRERIDTEEGEGNYGEGRESDTQEEVRELKRQVVEMKIASLQENRELRDVIDGLERRGRELEKEKEELQEKLVDATTNRIEGEKGTVQDS